MVSLRTNGGEDDDDDETQELEEPDSPPSVRVGDCECTMPQEETLPLDDETELVREDTTGLWGETQVLEGDTECGIGTWVDTQVVDDEETEGGSERTEVLSDDGDGLSDDGASASPFGDKDRGGDDGIGGQRTFSERRQSSTTPILDEHCSEKDPTVASEALTCGERSSGSAKRSFSAVRTASLQASGRAAKHSMTPKCSSLIDDSDAVSKHGCGSDRSYRVGGSSVRKLFCENIEKEDRSEKTDVSDGELAKETIESFEKEDSFQMPIQACSAAGLSYIASQEPGELSQANALDVVDKFLSINNIGLSQDACVGKTGETSMPPLSSTKGGAQCLAKSAHRSPVGKETIYEWINSLEDEGGGDFFVKRKSSLFTSDKHLKKSRSQPPKSKHPCQGASEISIDNGKVKEGTGPGAQSKSHIVSFSDSTIKAHPVIGSKKMQHFENRTVKKLIKDMNADVDPEYTNQQLEVIGMDMDGICEVGPDTQMAAEAMEALLCGSPAERDLPAAARNGTEYSRKIGKLSRGSLEPVTLEKKPTDFDGILRRSKRTKMSGVDTGGKSRQSSRNDLKKSKARNKLLVDTSGKPMNEKSIPDENVRLLESVKGYEVSNRKSLPIKDDDIRKKVAKSSASVKRSRVDRENLGMPTKRLKLDGENLQLNVNVTPIARRTRQSMAEKTFKQVDVINQLSSDGESLQTDMNFTPVACRTRQSMTRRISEQVDVLSKSNVELPASVRNRSACRQSSNMDCCDSSGTAYDKQRGNVTQHRHDIQDSKSSQQVASIVSSLPLVTPFHPKRRRTCLDASRYSTDEVVPGCKPSSLQHNQSEAIDKNVPSVQKRRAAGGLLLVADEMCSRDMSTTTRVRTRSSASHGCKPFQFKSNRVIKGTNLFGGGPFCSNTLVGISHENILPKESVPTKSASHGEDIEDLRPGTSLKEKGPSADANCTSLNKVIEGSPICTGLNPLQTLKKTLSKPSLVKELIRLESTEVTQIPLFNEPRRRRDMSTVRILFSRHLDEDIVKHQKKILTRLGISVASNIADATHFITDKFVRTRNLLEAMAVGKPVVTPMWLKSCGQARCFIDEKNYILRDLKKEKAIGFSMLTSLAHARHNPLLQGKRVFVTPNVKPDRETVSNLIKAAGGQPVERIGRTIINEDKVPDELLAISCEEDYSICSPLLEKGTEIFDSELLLNGIVIQKLEYDRHRLFLDHVRQTRSTIWLRSESGDQFLPVSKRQ